MVAAASPITSTLPGFPQINQLVDPPSDPYPDNNQRMNCVPASLAAGASWLLGRILYASQLKDAVEGLPYQGPQAASSYVGYLAGMGVALTPYNNTSGAQLVAHIHQRLAAGQPVVVTIPSQWGIPYPDPLHPAGYTHVVVMCGSGNGWLRAMNPWGGFWHDGSDSYWIPRLCMGQVWDMSLLVKGSPMAWTQHGSGAIDGAGHTVGAGLAALLITTHAPDGKRSETPFNAAGDVFVDMVDGSVVTWTHSEGARTDRGGLVIDAQLAEIAALNAQIAALQSRPTSDPVEHAKATALDGLLAIYGVK
jgi:hypothetical protein